MSLKQQTKQRGLLIILVLVFGSILFLVVASFLGFVIAQGRLQEAKLQEEKALAIAEAGLNYYKWFLAHYPDDVTNGTGLPGPYVMSYDDVETGTIGEYSLAIASSTFCGDVTHIDIESTGYTLAAPERQRTIYARYTRPTVAEFSFITAQNVWFGSGGPDHIGPIHANGGIRMDGGHNSIVTSGQTTWTCTSSFNCSPDQTVDGVFGSGPNFDLWVYPSVPIDFGGITLDLAQMLSKAQTGGGIHIPASAGHGYHVVMNADNTIDVSVVNNTVEYWAYESGIGWVRDDDIINSSTFVNTYTINPDCPLVFIEDKVWLEGELSSRFSIASGNTTDASIIIEGDIEYAADGAGLLAVARDNVEVGVDVPENLHVSGIYIAQTGSYRRNYLSSTYLPVGHQTKDIIDSMDFLGTIVSSGRAVTTWVDGSGSTISGIDNGSSSFDRDLVDNPPPLTPETSDDYKFVEWREEI